VAAASSVDTLAKARETVIARIIGACLPLRLDETARLKYGALGSQAAPGPYENDELPNTYVL